jgi:hypothetical protein
MGEANRDRGEPRDSSPPTPPYIRVRIRRFTGLSANGFFSSAPEAQTVGTVGLASAPLNSAVWASPFPAVPKGQRPGFSTVWPLEIPISKCLFQRSGLQRNSFRLLCRLLTSPPRSRALRLAQSAFPDATEISRGKIDRLPCTPAGFTTPSFDDHGLRDHLLARPAG